MCKGMQIFFLAFNVKKYFEGTMKKDTFDYFKGYTPHWEKQPKYIKQICGNISDAVNSQIITIEHVKLFLINHFVFSDEKFKWASLKVDDIIETSYLYSKKRFEKDKKFLMDLSERLKPKTVLEKLSPAHDKLYKINADGKNYLYSLVMNSYISPMIISKLYETTFILNENELDERMLRFIKAIKQVKNLI